MCGSWQGWQGSALTWDRISVEARKIAVQRSMKKACPYCCK